MEVPINDPSSRGYTFTLSKLVAGKRSQINLQYFAPPRSNKGPGVEDMIHELQTEFHKVGRRQKDGKECTHLPQPFLGTVLVLQTWLGNELFLELMEL